MSKTLQYTRPNRLDALQDQLWAAGIRPERVTGLGDSITIVVPDGADVAAVQAVVDAHNPAALDAAAQLQATQQASARAKAVAVATTAVGVNIAALTPAQALALIAVLLYKEGALNADGTVKPLSLWT